MLQKEDLLPEAEYYTYFDTGGTENTIKLEPGQIAFTLCQVPVIYSSGSEEAVSISFSDGDSRLISGCTLDAETSRMILNRSGEIREIRFTTDHI